MTNQHFNSLSRRRLIAGLNACYENATNLHSAAKDLGTNGNYGLANSLLILSVEECVKGNLFMEKLTFPHKTLNVKGVFYQHRPKHIMGFEDFIEINKASEQLLKTMYCVGMSSDLDESDKKLMDERYKEVLEVRKQNKHIKIKLWWEKANNYKNYGLYVGYNKNGKLKTPKNTISEKEYLKSYYIVSSFLQMSNFITEYRFYND